MSKLPSGSAMEMCMVPSGRKAKLIRRDVKVSETGFCPSPFCLEPALFVIEKDALLNGDLFEVNQ